MPTHQHFSNEYWTGRQERSGLLETEKQQKINLVRNRANCAIMNDEKKSPQPNKSLFA
jgi:hypothetical protein